ncbi:MAG: 4-(cytidine 5'-diphospho)-2-C-methyl-D-erythritol kinase [Caulobacteraceae bacterium]
MKAADAPAFAGFAPAKVNLFLHVGPLAEDGYHPVSTLVVFADLGDRLWLQPSKHPAFHVEGPFAGELADEDDNLVVKARELFAGFVKRPLPPFHLTLEKHLPVASGLGGGSSDAAATLAMLRVAFCLGEEDDERAFFQMAAALGADVPACLAARPVIAEGRGERLAEAPSIPVLHAVLVNPGAPSSTAKVFAAYDARRPARADRPSLPKGFSSVGELAGFLEGCRNDLEASAVALAPEIAEALASLSAAPETLLARLSGSGGTCFSLCENRAHAKRLAEKIAGAHPGWWVRACRLNP